MNARPILVPTDFSSSADAALDCATELAKSTGAKLLIIHVELAPELKAPYDDEDDPQEHLAHRLLNEARPNAPTVDSEHKLLKGNVADEILNFAKGNQVNMIVMGTRGQTNSPKAVMGEVAQAVVRQATCRVITVRPVAAESEMVES